ncbi:Mov34/MPN/PAD-1 family protein [Xanthomonas campestris]|jgi:integrative and conjugative element protein (TIGR02256 family)|uniref:Mov34/MPN/PAD-1 family protein n=2 Tax=Xanthomonas campestris TaxID=339 RepID=UPI0009BD0828
MPFMSSWASPDRKMLLNFSASTLEVFNAHIQHRDTDCEAGGLLLGTVHGVHLLINEATAPTKWDKRFRYLFERTPLGHASIALARWRASHGTVRYLGEWHTHPEDQPTPSSLDRSEWHRLAKERKDERPLLAVIVGRKVLHVEMIPAGEKVMLLQSIE